MPLTLACGTRMPSTIAMDGSLPLSVDASPVPTGFESDQCSGLTTLDV